VPSDSRSGLLYLDSSALVKLIVAEPETPALLEFLRLWPQRVSSALARVEILRAIRRAGAAPPCAGGRCAPWRESLSSGSTSRSWPRRPEYRPRSSAPWMPSTWPRPVLDDLEGMIAPALRALRSGPGRRAREGTARLRPASVAASAMSTLAFVTDQHSISRILEHLGLRSPQLDRPPPPAREILRVAEHGEGWGVPADWS
jgi:hypothetical protein